MLISANIGKTIHIDFKNYLLDFNIPIIFIDVSNENKFRIEAFEIGGVDCISKPFNNLEILARIHTQLSLKYMREQLIVRNIDLEKQVATKIGEIYEAQLAIIFAVSTLAESRDDDTGKHVNRVSAHSKKKAEYLITENNSLYQINKDFATTLYNSSTLHDIGKIAIPDTILLKPSKLSMEEFDIIKTHTTVGADKLREVLHKFPNIPFLSMSIEISNFHHEKWDGSGYPLGLIGFEIPLSARIVAIADVFDALVSKRVYKEAYSLEKAIEIMTKERGKHFDPFLLDIFLKNILNFYKHHESTI